jgi:hypothetical protein
MEVEINGVVYEDFLVTRTFDWNIFLPSSLPNIELNKGENVVRITQKQSLSSRPDKLEFVSDIQIVNTIETSRQETTVFPNPSNGIFNIRASDQNHRFAVVSLEGEIVQQGILKQNEIDLTNYPRGIYFLQLSSDSGTIVKKLVVD